MVIIFDRLIKQLIKHLEHGSWGFFFYLIGLPKFFDYDCFFFFKMICMMISRKQTFGILLCFLVLGAVWFSFLRLASGLRREAKLQKLVCLGFSEEVETLKCRLSESIVRLILAILANARGSSETRSFAKVNRRRFNVG